MSFQAKVGARLASQLVAGRGLTSQFDLTNAAIWSLRFESETPLDDLLIETNGNGFIFVQAKTSLDLSTREKSELAKTAEQIVRQWQACAAGEGKRGWDRPLSPERDAFVIAVGPTASGRVRNDLAKSLARLRLPANPTETIPQGQIEALTKFTGVLEAAWQRAVKKSPAAGEIDRILPFIRVVCWDMDGPDRDLAVEMLRTCLVDGEQSEAAFSVLSETCTHHMVSRTGADAAGFRGALEAAGVRLTAAPDYRADVDALVLVSQHTSEVLGLHGSISLDGQDYAVDRQCYAAVVSAAQAGSLLLIGEPGSGKSAALSHAATALRQAGHPVVQLAVDRLPVQGLDGLRIELGLGHPVRDVLANWPGAGPAFLVIDALDASRGSATEAVFRQLIAEILGLADQRWRVLASIRSFDLRLGRTFRELFGGTPPDASFSDSFFSSVRHIQIPTWSDQEFTDLLDRTPALESALAAGGERLRDLARVPFNTRLLAELITEGLEPAELQVLSNQKELLKLYWEHRVLIHGPGAEVCLHAVVGEMIARSALRAPYQVGGSASADSFEQLLRSAVLVAHNGDRHVAFRHHILFDYAASRLYLNPYDAQELKVVLDRSRGVGLLLAPALSFALQELWTSEDLLREAYWSVLTLFLGDDASDPIARSVAARSACELTRTAEDVEGLVAQLSVEGVGSQLFQILGALAIRLEDESGDAPVHPWVQLASALSQASGLENHLRFLLGLLIKRPDAQDHLNALGESGRQLLQSTFAQTEANYSPNLVIAAIGFVTRTYATDKVASRELLERVFEPERFDLHAHHEVPWLAEGVGAIAPVDPEFTKLIYRQAFAKKVSSNEPTPMGSSQILPLTSNARQDYEMARHHLTRYFPRLLAESPDTATDAMLAALEGYAASEHSPAPDVDIWTITLAEGVEIELREDSSYIWAWDPEADHPDEVEVLLNAVIGHVREAPGAEAVRIVRRLMEQSPMSLVWARLLMLAAVRAAVLGDLLWPVATQTPFVLCDDTRKDAIDFIAASYSAQDVEEQRAFEERILAIDLSSHPNPTDARQRMNRQVFGTIGAEHLATEEARGFVEAQPSSSSPPPNERPFKISTTTGAPEKWWWLRSAGVDLQDPKNTDLLEHAERVEAALGLSRNNADRQVADTDGAMVQLQELEAAMEQARSEGAPLDVLRVPGEVLARGCEAIASASAAPDDVIACVIGMAVKLANTHPYPEVAPEEEARFDRWPSWSSPAPRIDAARTIMELCRRQDPPEQALLETVENLVTDPHPAVRMTAVQSLTVLWNTSRPLMWDLAKAVAREESNRSVLHALTTGVLARVRNAAPEHVEELVLELREHISQDHRDDEPRQKVQNDIGTLVALLWIDNERPLCREIVSGWAAQPLDHVAELDGVLSMIRSRLILGYESDSATEQSIRQRTHDVVAQTVEVVASGLESIYALDRKSQGAQVETARAYLHILDRTCNELYFASGAFDGSKGGEGKGLQSDNQKRMFLVDVETTLRRIGDVGSPPTIHHLLELLSFLGPGDPGRAFDVTASALLEGGRRLGYQFEVLGANTFVALVGYFLADHRELFDDGARRRALVDCLDVFIEAGLPAARRLLYQLPELLR